MLLGMSCCRLAGSAWRGGAKTIDRCPSIRRRHTILHGCVHQDAETVNSRKDELLLSDGRYTDPIRGVCVNEYATE